MYKKELYIKREECDLYFITKRIIWRVLDPNLDQLVLEGCQQVPVNQAVLDMI